jgi:hypothetical protein
MRGMGSPLRRGPAAGRGCAAAAAGGSQPGARIASAKHPHLVLPRLVGDHDAPPLILLVAEALWVEARARAWAAAAVCAAWQLGCWAAAASREWCAPGASSAASAASAPGGPLPGLRQSQGSARSRPRGCSPGSGSARKGVSRCCRALRCWDGAGALVLPPHHHPASRFAGWGARSVRELASFEPTAVRSDLTRDVFPRRGVDFPTERHAVKLSCNAAPRVASSVFDIAIRSTAAVVIKSGQSPGLRLTRQLFSHIPPSEHGVLAPASWAQDVGSAGPAGGATCMPAAPRQARTGSRWRQRQRQHYVWWPLQGRAMHATSVLGSTA